MLKVEGLKLPPGGDREALCEKAASLLGVDRGEVLSLRILRRGVDARKDPALVYTAAVEVRNEGAVLRRAEASHRRRARNGNRCPVTRYAPEPPYRLPEAVSVPGSGPVPAVRPVVAGAGPAGLFAALVLAHAGARPVLLERGKAVEERRADVERFRSGGPLDPESNVQFGEGGAGAFSDGKLNTGTRDPRHRFILEQLVRWGAPEEILIDAKPHVGTDRLFQVLREARRELLSLGADIRFSHCLTDIRTAGNHLAETAVSSPAGAYTMPCRYLILCPGHSARDTFAMLRRRNVPMTAKPFAVGVRIEHRQSDCDAAQYRNFAGHPGLPVSTYKLSCHTSGGRGVFTFCVCPGGEVIAAASEAGGCVTNGMSAYARDRENINGGLLVGVTPEDFGAGSGEYAGPLAGIAFQRRLEQAAYELGGGGYYAPVQRTGDFLEGRPSTGPGRVVPSYRPGVTWTDLRLCLPEFVTEALTEALPVLGRKLAGFDSPDGILTAVESRSSSPVRILRDETGQSPIRGLYPCGEGGGWAGGILSAAADGMRCAEQVCSALSGEQ